MCGIAGVINNNDTEIVKGFLSLISHRGKDNTSIVHEHDFCIGHNRLSIIDLSPHGNQPFSNGHGHYLACNGEVYNYQEIAKTINNNPNETSDCKCFFDALIKKGMPLLTQIDGFFAAVFITPDDIFLMRDFFGKKPLYYKTKNGAIYFSSEVKSFAALLPSFEPNATVQSDIIKYRFSSDMSPVSGIKMLPKGSYLRFNRRTKDVSIYTYYSLLDNIKWNPKISEKEAIDTYDNLLQSAVKKRLIADVKLSSCNSGGLDSSLVSAIAASYGKLDLLHVDVENNSEFPYADAISKKLGCTLHRIPFNKDNFQELLPKTVWHYEYPLVHANNIGLMALSEHAHKLGIKVILTGEGADEALGGYRHHQIFLRYHGLSRFIPIKLKTIMRNLTKNPIAYKSLSPLNSPESYSEYLLMEAYESAQKRYQDYYGAFEADYLAYLALEFDTYINPLLLRGDKLLMANQIETRMPFMDKALVEFSLGLPMKFRKDKWILKKVAERYLPHEIIYRPKQGFATPFTQTTGKPFSLETMDLFLSQLNVRALEKQT